MIECHRLWRLRKFIHKTALRCLVPVVTGSPSYCCNALSLVSIYAALQLHDLLELTRLLLAPLWDHCTNCTCCVSSWSEGHVDVLAGDGRRLFSDFCFHLLVRNDVCNKRLIPIFFQRRHNYFFVRPLSSAVTRCQSLRDLMPHSRYLVRINSSFCLVNLRDDKSGFMQLMYHS